MKCQILFSRKNKKNIISLSSAEFAHSIESVNRNFYVIYQQFYTLPFTTLWVYSRRQIDDVFLLFPENRI